MFIIVHKKKKSVILQFTWEDAKYLILVLKKSILILDSKLLKLCFLKMFNCKHNTCKILDNQN